MREAETERNEVEKLFDEMCEAAKELPKTNRPDLFGAPLNVTIYHPADPPDVILVPSTISMPRCGFRAGMWRRIGKLFNRDDWYQRGCGEIDIIPIVNAMLGRDSNDGV
jgi:hypothetical protein